MARKLLSILVIVLSYLIYKRAYHTTIEFENPTEDHPIEETPVMSKALSPVFFVSHGGPTFMLNNDTGGNRGCFATVQKIGSRLLNEIKPKFVIFVSGHWESSSSDTFEVGIPDSSLNAVYQKSSPHIFQKLEADEHSLYYDFYNFPDIMYRQRIHLKGSKPLAESIKEELTKNGLKSKLTERGLDHGVWVPLKSAFSKGELITDSGKFDLDVPVVQVSLAKTEDFGIHYKLGQALAPFREEGLVIVSGSSVHNLRELGLASITGQKALPYGPEFNAKLSNIITNHSGAESLKLLNELKLADRDLLYKAHPTLDHFMPIVVGVGAAENLKAKELYSDATLSLGWNIYEWN